jgi:hypothetical protein
MHEVLAPATRDVSEVLDAMVAVGAVGEQDRGEWTGPWAVGDAAKMVDAVVARARAARANEPEAWA